MADGARSGGADGVSGRRRRRRRRSSGGAANAAVRAGETASGLEASTTGTGAGRARSAAGRTTVGGGAAASTAGGIIRSGKKRSGAERSGKKRSGAKGAGGKVGGRRRPKPTTKREISAGGVVYRRNDDGIEVVLASRRTRRGQLAWGLAKGGIEDGESMEDAAIREVREETGLRAEIETSLGETRYFYVWEEVRIRKTVHFFLMRHTGGDVDDRDDEMEEIRWFPLERALKRAAYRGERDVLKRAAELLG